MDKDEEAEYPVNQWLQVLTKEQFYITRKKGTESPFTGLYYAHDKKGVYVCVCCKQDLFSSNAKYDSNSGWPSFFEPIKKENVKTKPDHSRRMRRTEVICSACDSHLGHVFDEKKELKVCKTGLRYCINSVSLDFREDA